VPLQQSLEYYAISLCFDAGFERSPVENWLFRRFLILAAVSSLAAAWFFGHFAYDASVERYLTLVFTQAAKFERLSYDASGRSSLFKAVNDRDCLIGYVTATEGRGYGGPMLVVVGWSGEGSLLTLRVPKHKEDAAWFRLLENKGFYEQYLGKKDNDPFEFARDIDAVSGATLSSYGVADGVLKARALVANHLGHTIPARVRAPVQVALPEILLLLGLCWVILLRTFHLFNRTKWRRLPSLVFGFVVLGIWLGQPLSLVNFTTWLVGYFSPIQANILLYSILFGVLGTALLLGKNFYCFWLCPFSAVQEGAHLLTGSTIRPDQACGRKLRGMRYMLLWFALFLAFLLEAPSATIFEPWTALFTLKGTTAQWFLVGIALVGGMVVHNFWCIFLCPVGAMLEIVLKMRQWTIGLWKKEGVE